MNIELLWHAATFNLHRILYSLRKLIFFEHTLFSSIHSNYFTVLQLNLLHIMYLPFFRLLLYPQAFETCTATCSLQCSVPYRLFQSIIVGFTEQNLRSELSHCLPLAKRFRRSSSSVSYWSHRLLKIETGLMLLVLKLESRVSNSFLSFMFPSLISSWNIAKVTFACTFKSSFHHGYRSSQYPAKLGAT